MSAYDDLTRAITCRYNDRIKKSCAPLQDHLNINRFFYYKITCTGQFTYFYSCVERSEYYGAVKLYVQDPFFRHPKNFESGIHLLKSYSDEKRFKPMLSTARDFGINLILHLIKKNDLGVEAFGFCSESIDVSNTSLILSETPLLKIFASQFRKNNPDLFAKLEDQQINLSSLIGHSLFNQYNPINPKIAEKEKFLQRIGIHQEKNLSPIENKILAQVLKGYSARQIALEIYLSKRTVEHHIERIKHKLDCRSKVELLDKGRELSLNGYMNYDYL